MRLTWFRFMVFIDVYLIHPWWDRFHDETWLGEMLCNFCQYAHGGLVLAINRGFHMWKISTLKVRWLQWLWGWACLAQGLVAIVTFGQVRCEWSLNVSMRMLKMFINKETDIIGW